MSSIRRDPRRILTRARRRTWLLAALGLGLLAPDTPACAEQFEVTVGPATASGPSTITLPIVATLERPVGAAQLELLHDPARLRWVGSEAGALTRTTLNEANSREPGRVTLAFAGGDEVEGAGALFLVTFEWIGTGTDKTTIELRGVRAWDGQTGLELTTRAVPGELEPKAPPVPAAPTPPPDAPETGTGVLPFVVMAGVGLVVVALLVSRSKRSRRPGPPTTPAG